MQAQIRVHIITPCRKESLSVRFAPVPVFDSASSAYPCKIELCGEPSLCGVFAFPSSRSFGSVAIPRPLRPRTQR